jgi:hypothetical protein
MRGDTEGGGGGGGGDVQVVLVSWHLGSRTHCTSVVGMWEGAAFLAKSRLTMNRVSNLLDIMRLQNARGKSAHALRGKSIARTGS